MTLKFFKIIKQRAGIQIKSRESGSSAHHLKELRVSRTLLSIKDARARSQGCGQQAGRRPQASFPGYAYHKIIPDFLGTTVELCFYYNSFGFVLFCGRFSCGPGHPGTHFVIKDDSGFLLLQFVGAEISSLHHHVLFYVMLRRELRASIPDRQAH